MAKDILHRSGGNASDTIIIIPDSVKKSLPRDFDIGDIGKIDLKEAETIANEDIFLIREIPCYVLDSVSKNKEFIRRS